MSGAVAAHAAYNGSGTQGLAVTNKVDDTGDLMSVFWNKNDTLRQLLYGSAFIEVPAEGGSGTNAVGASSNVQFEVNNDIDCLGDLVLKVLYTDNSDTTPNTGRSELAGQKLASCINRVEVRVGTQIWQTIENTDLLSLNATELSPGAFADYSYQTSAGDVYGEIGSNQVVAYIPLKVFTKTLLARLESFSEQTETGYLMGAAPHQHVKIKIFTDPEFTDSNSTGTPSTLSFNLYAKNQVMCNEEREQMKAMPMGLPKRVKMTQNKNVTSSATGLNLEIDLDSFSLYTSHLLISFPSPSVATQLLSGTAELLLNSSSFSGKLPLGLLKITGPTMGLFTNAYTANNSDESLRDIFVFPLASQAFGGSAVPLNRFDNIRLKLIVPSGTWSAGVGDINVTCVGETTALYKGGAASLAMY